MQKQLIPDSDVAKMLSVSRATVWRYVKAGILPEPIKFVGATRFDLAEVIKALEVGRQK
jgi:predicted DNA-binding transcriptional regulator AlpA